LFLKTDGAGNLSFDSLSFSTPLAVIGNATSGSEIRLPEDTDNGSNYVALKAPDTIASNLTLTLPSADGTSGQVLQTNGSGVLSFSSPSVASLSTASGSAPSYSARSWVNFNGTGTVAIREDGNVSSITDNGTGDYTVNFTTAMQDANYCAQVTSQGNEGNPQSACSGIFHIGFASGSIRVSTFTAMENNVFRDLPSVMVTTFR
jgi:hypothetical protein